MAKVVIESEAVNGEYDLDLSYFTNRELHVIKKETGIRAGELFEALNSGDNDILVALALIAIRRKGEYADADELWNLPAGKITLDVTEEDDDGPPALTPSDEQSESSDDGRSSSTPSATSGESSPEQ